MLNNSDYLDYEIRKTMEYMMSHLLRINAACGFLEKNNLRRFNGDTIESTKKHKGNPKKYYHKGWRKRKSL